MTSYMIIAVVLGLGLFSNFITRTILCTSTVFVVEGLSVRLSVKVQYCIKTV